MVDYMFADQDAVELITSINIWEGNYMDGSNYRPVSCIYKLVRIATHTEHPLGLPEVVFM